MYCHGGSQGKGGGGTKNFRMADDPGNIGISCLLTTSLELYRHITLISDSDMELTALKPSQNINLSPYIPHRRIGEEEAKFLLFFTSVLK